MAKTQAAENRIAIGVLDELLAGELLESRVDSWLNSLRSCKDSWYNRLKNEKGEKVAEEELENYAKREGFQEFAGSLRPIVKGLKKLAESKNTVQFFQHFDDCRKILYPMNYCIQQDGGKMLVAFNPDQSFCGCNGTPGMYLWGKFGVLHLEAVIIQYSGLDLSIDLVFPSKEEPGRESPGNQFVFLQEARIIEIRQDGHLTPKGSRQRVRVGQYLQSLLGLQYPADMIDDTNSLGGSVESGMGFPGAHDFLLKYIGKLGPYFEELVKLREGKHKH